MSIGAKLKVLRQHRGWSQQKLADRSGVSQTHLSQIERGKIGRPHLSTITDLLEALNVSSGKVLKRAFEAWDEDEFMDSVRG